jgi:hypothetical protein
MPTSRDSGRGCFIAGIERVPRIAIVEVWVLPVVTVSTPVSPSVVAAILMIQKVRVTAGALLKAGYRPGLPLLLWEIMR